MPNFIEQVQAVKKVNLISREQLTFGDSRLFLCGYRTLLRNHISEQLWLLIWPTLLRILLCDFHTRWPLHFFIPWCKKGQKWPKTQIKESSLKHHNTHNMSRCLSFEKTSTWRDVRLLRLRYLRKQENGEAKVDSQKSFHSSGFHFLFSKLWTVTGASLFALKLCRMLEKICRGVSSSPISKRIRKGSLFPRKFA